MIELSSSWLSLGRVPACLCSCCPRSQLVIVLSFFFNIASDCQYMYTQKDRIKLMLK